MKALLRTIIIYAVSLKTLEFLIIGFRIEGTLITLLTAAVVLALLYKFLHPILKMLTFPINIMTFGTASLLTNIVVFYLFTRLVPQVKISSFVFPGLTFSGIVIPKVAISLFFVYIVTSIALFFIVSGIRWLLDE